MQQVSFSPASQSEKIPGHEVPVNNIVPSTIIYLLIKFSTMLGPSLQLKGLRVNLTFRAYFPLKLRVYKTPKKPKGIKDKITLFLLKLLIKQI